jgi:hypothetical protein
MNRDPNDRPSIFNRPFDEDDLEATGPQRVEPPRAQAPRVEPPPAAASPDRPIRPRPPEEARPPQHASEPERTNRQLIVLGSMGLAILALGGFIGASLLSPDQNAVVASEPSLTPEPSMTAEASRTATASEPPAATATADPTPEPTPAGPPAEVAVGGWATVTVGELNVRSNAGADNESRYRLVEGAVVHVAEGPTTIDGGNWYRIASLGGAAGWVSAGWVAEPFLTTLVDDPTLIRCGPVQREVFAIEGGRPEPRDPLRIDDLAVPAAAFDEESLAVLELIRGMQREACFSAVVGGNGLPVIRAELNADACGHAVAEGDFFRLRPASGDGVSLSSQVNVPIVIHPSLLIGGSPDDRKSSNMRTILSMMANDGAIGCVNGGVIEGEGTIQVHRAANTSQCSVVHEYNRDSLKLSPASGGPTAWIKLSADGYQAGQFVLETRVTVNVNAWSANGDQQAYAWAGEAC